MELVVAFLVCNNEHNEQAHRHTHCQAKDIDERKYLVFEDISNGDIEIISEHGT
jgi:hypothetical protein